MHDFQRAPLALGSDAFQAAAEHANAVSQKRAVGWKEYVVFDRRRVRPHFVAFGYTLLARYAIHPLMNLFGDSTAGQGKVSSGDAAGGPRLGAQVVERRR